MSVELMEKTTLDISTDQFVDGFLSGCAKIIQHQETLNAINVFPVADKDTGNNIAKTLGGLLSARFNLASIKGFLSQVADFTFDSARGNSGVMFSILIDGMKNAAHEVKSIESDQFVALFESGYKQLTQEVKHIAKGTLVTIIDDFCHILRQTHSASQSVVEHLETAMPKLNQALQDSMNQMEVLKKNNVVDAGAKAFVYFVEGFYQGLKNPKKKAYVDIVSLPDESEAHETIADKPDFRFCTEGMVELDGNLGELVDQWINANGDSQLIRRHGNKVRFHVHCDEPWELFRKLGKVGTISQTKVDDMLRQFQVGQHENQSIALITDTSADLPQSVIEDNLIHQIPINVNFDEHELLDKYCVKAEDLYNQLDDLRTYPKTSAPILGLIREKVNYLKEHYEQIIIIPLSSKLSSTYEAFEKVVRGDERVHLIDSKSVSAGHGLIVAYAAKLISQGGDLEQILDKIKAKVSEVSAYMTVFSMESMIRSGRVSPLKGAIAKTLNVKPVVSLTKEGAAKIVTKAFSFKQAMNKIAKLVEQKHQQKPVKELYVLHVKNEESANEMAQMLEDKIGVKAALITNASPSIGLHVGIGAIEVAILQ